MIIIRRSTQSEMLNGKNDLNKLELLRRRSHRTAVKLRIDYLLSWRAMQMCNDEENCPQVDGYEMRWRSCPRSGRRADEKSVASLSLRQMSFFRRLHTRASFWKVD